MSSSAAGSTQLPNETEEEKYERSRAFDLDFYRSTDDGYSTVAGAQNDEINKLVAKRESRQKLPADSILRDPAIRRLIQEDKEQMEAKETEIRMQEFVKTRMRRDNVSNLFQTPKIRENGPTTAADFQPITDAEPIDRTYYFKRDDFKNYSEDLIKYKHTMR